MSGLNYPSKWTRVDLGADDGAPSVPARSALRYAPMHVDAWLKFQPPGDRAYVVHARFSFEAVEREIANAMAKRLQAEGVEVGAIGGRLKKRVRRIKALARKVASAKAFRAVRKIAQRALNNPLVKAAIAATPMGAAALATRAAARVAAQAIRGKGTARALFRTAARGVMSGDESAIELARMLEGGVRQIGAYSLIDVEPSPNELRRLASVCGKTADAYMQPWAVKTASYHLVGQDDGDDGSEEALETFAESGAWEGMRWLGHRLALRSAARHPDAGSMRDMLMLGREAMGARYAR